MQNKTITFRLKKHLNRSKGCCCVFFRPSRFQSLSLPVSLFSPSGSFHISLYRPHPHIICMCVYVNIHILRDYQRLPFFIQNTWAKRLLFFIILYTHTYNNNNNHNVTRSYICIRSERELGTRFICWNGKVIRRNLLIFRDA